MRLPIYAVIGKRRSGADWSREPTYSARLAAKRRMPSDMEITGE